MGVTLQSFQIQISFMMTSSNINVFHATGLCGTNAPTVRSVNLRMNPYKDEKGFNVELNAKFSHKAQAYVIHNMLEKANLLMHLNSIMWTYFYRQ